MDRRVADLADVRARVGEGHDGPRVAQRAQQHLLVLRVEARLDEQLLEVGLDRQVDHQLHRVDAPLAGHLGDGRVRRQPLLVDPDALEVGRAGLRADAGPAAVVGVARGVDQPRPELAGRRAAPGAARPRAARGTRSTRGAGRTGSLVLNDSRTEMPRQWVWRDEAAALATRLRRGSRGAGRRLASRRSPNVIGTWVSAARFAVPGQRALALVGVGGEHAAVGRLEDARAERRPSPRRAARPRPTTRGATRRVGCRRSRGARCATS